MRIVNTLIIGLIIIFVGNANIAGQDKVITIEGYDRLKFSKSEIEVNAGEEVKLTLKTISNLPKSQMAHNWVLLKKGTDAERFATNTRPYKENEYINPDMEDKIIAMTGMLGGGESETITFTAPSETGKYIYVCTFPGHYIAGMKGTLVVK